MEEKHLTRAILIGADTGEYDAESSMDELSELAKTAGAEELARVLQKREAYEPATVIGEGKLAEVKELCGSLGAELLIFDCELTASQIRNVEDETDVRVIDRTMLILDIFAGRAVSREGKLQVELAQLKYRLPRLMGIGASLSRLGGGIGTRGPGETQLETDRRHIRRRIDKLSAELKELEERRGYARDRRKKDSVQVGAIVGYTNAGKSTLLNLLTGADVLAEDKLFATLDPTTRRLSLPRGCEILLTDTVGFIDRLPMHLVKAFKSTLEEATFADIIVHLVDASEPADERTRKQGVTLRLLEELGVSGKPVIEVYNKMDAAVDADFIPPAAVCISAATGAGIDRLLDVLEQTAESGSRTVKFFFPHKNARAAGELFDRARVVERAYTDEGICLTVCCDEKTIGRYRQFQVDDFGQ